MKSVIFPKLESRTSHKCVCITYKIDNRSIGNLMCRVRLRHKDKTAQCRFFVVPADGTTLLGMSDTESLDIVKIVCGHWETHK